MGRKRRGASLSQPRHPSRQKVVAGRDGRQSRITGGRLVFRCRFRRSDRCGQLVRRENAVDVRPLGAGDRCNYSTRRSGKPSRCPRPSAASNGCSRSRLAAICSAGGKGSKASVVWLEQSAQRRDLANWQMHTLASVGWMMSLEAMDINRDDNLDLVVSDRKGANPRSFLAGESRPRSRTRCRMPGGVMKSAARMRKSCF